MQSSFDLDAYRSDRHDRAILRLFALLYVTNQVDNVLWLAGIWCEAGSGVTGRFRFDSPYITLSLT